MLVSLLMLLYTFWVTVRSATKGKVLFLVLNTLALENVALGLSPMVDIFNSGPESSPPCGATCTLAHICASTRSITIKVPCAQWYKYCVCVCWLTSILEQTGTQQAFLLTLWSAVHFIPPAWAPHSSGMNCLGEGLTVRRHRQGEWEIDGECTLVVAGYE